MRSVVGRVSRLEQQFAALADPEPLLVVVKRMDRRLALDSETCVQILRESGYFRGSGIRVVSLGKVPDGLDAAQLERFLRENGASIT
jgi:hypothetical protein